MGRMHSVYTYGSCMHRCISLSLSFMDSISRINVVSIRGRERESDDEGMEILAKELGGRAVEQVRIIWTGVPILRSFFFLLPSPSLPFMLFENVVDCTPFYSNLLNFSGIFYTVSAIYKHRGLVQSVSRLRAFFR